MIQAGIRVFAAEAECARAFERDVQLRAADLDPALRRARESLLRRYVVR